MYKRIVSPFLFLFDPESVHNFTFTVLKISYKYPMLNNEHDGYAWVSYGKWPKPLHMGLRNTLQSKTNQTKFETVFSLIGYLENETT